MKLHRCLLRIAVLLWAFTLASAPIHAAPRKARPAQKERAAKAAIAPPHDDFQQHVEREIADLKQDVYTRATWTKLQEVRQRADDTAANMKVGLFTAGAIGFVLGCVLTFLLSKRSGTSQENLRIT